MPTSTATQSPSQTSAKHILPLRTASHLLSQPETGPQCLYTNLHATNSTLKTNGERHLLQKAFSDCPSLLWTPCLASEPFLLRHVPLCVSLPLGLTEGVKVLCFMSVSTPIQRSLKMGMFTYLCIPSILVQDLGQGWHSADHLGLTSISSPHRFLCSATLKWTPD